MHESEGLLRRGYDMFNEKNIEAAMEIMHEDVDWPAVNEGTRVVGKEAVAGYWGRTFASLSPHLEILSMDEMPDGRLSVLVHQTARDNDGNLLGEGQVKHLYQFRDGLIERMDVEAAE
jgi:hypothetical protein